MQCTQEKRQRDEQGVKRAGTQQGYKWKWKNGGKWDENEKKHCREAKGTTGKKNTDLIQGLLYK